MNDPLSLFRLFFFSLSFYVSAKWTTCDRAAFKNRMDRFSRATRPCAGSRKTDDYRFFAKMINRLLPCRKAKAGRIRHPSSSFLPKRYIPLIFSVLLLLHVGRHFWLLACVGAIQQKYIDCRPCPAQSSLLGQYAHQDPSVPLRAVTFKID